MNKKVEDEEKAMREVFSLKIRKYRQRLGLSKYGLAAKADLSLNFITDMEGGRTGASFATLIKLAKALEVETHDLIRPEAASANSPMHGWGMDEVMWLADGIRKAVEKMLAQDKTRQE